MKQHPLQEYADFYLDHLLTEFDCLAASTQSIKAEYINYVEKIRKKEKSNKENSQPDCYWNELYQLEVLISKILPVERLPREVWRLRLRYRDVVGLTQYEAYLSSKPPDLTPEKVNENDYRADIEYLLTEIYVRYMATPFNENLRNKISSRITTFIIIGLAIVIGITAFFHLLKLGSLGPATLLLVIFIGAMGGLLSLQQRYQSISREGDPMDNISLLEQGSSRLFMPAIGGAIFSALLYMMIIGGLVEGDLFPALTNEATDIKNIDLLEQMRNASPVTVKDYAKLVVWSFIAGFAERFVPDTLSRFVSTRDGNAQRVI